MRPKSYVFLIRWINLLFISQSCLWCPLEAEFFGEHYMNYWLRHCDHICSLHGFFSKVTQHTSPNKSLDHVYQRSTFIDHVSPIILEIVEFTQCLSFLCIYSEFVWRDKDAPIHYVEDFWIWMLYLCEKSWFSPLFRKLVILLRTRHCCLRRALQFVFLNFFFVFLLMFGVLIIGVYLGVFGFEGHLVPP